MLYICITCKPILFSLGVCSKNGQFGLFSPSRGGLDILDLKHGCVLRTLIPKVAEGIFHVIAQFNETDEYVLYYHSGKKTLRVFRIIDGVMIANYRVPSNITSLESTSDGNNVALGMVDGNVSILTIADPKKRRMVNYLRNLPSRQGLQAVITGGNARISNLVVKKANVLAFVKATSPKHLEGQATSLVKATSSITKELETITKLRDKEKGANAADVVTKDKKEKVEATAAENSNQKHVSIREDIDQ